MHCFDPRGLVFLVTSLAFGLPAAALDWDPQDFGPAGQQLCFERVYDARHMATHPDQKIERMFFLTGLDPVNRRNEIPPNAPERRYSGFLATTVRGDKTPKWAGAWCGNGKPVSCITEGGQRLGYAARGPEGELILTGVPRTLYLTPDAEQRLGTAEFMRQTFGADDDNFHLYPKGIEVCQAEFARINPPDPALGVPLRERLKPDQPFCYGRDYDPDYLTSHPGQRTASIRISRGPKAIAADEAYHGYATKAQEMSFWPDSIDVIVSVATHSNTIPIQLSVDPIEQGFSCRGEGDQWTCTNFEPCNDARRLYLRRDTNDGMLVLNPDTALAVVDQCTTEGVGATKTDDKIFQLSPMPLSKCGL